MAENSPTFTHNDYTVGLICTLPDPELLALSSMLDEEHPILMADPGDSNSYCLGRMGHHNVVIACLPVS